MDIAGPVEATRKINDPVLLFPVPRGKEARPEGTPRELISR